MTNTGKYILVGAGILFLTRKSPGVVGTAVRNVTNTLAEGARSVGKAIAPSEQGQSFIDDIFGPSSGAPLAAAPANAGTPGQSMLTAPTYGIAGTTDGYAEPVNYFDAKSIFGGF